MLARKCTKIEHSNFNLLWAKWKFSASKITCCTVEVSLDGENENTAHICSNHVLYGNLMSIIFLFSRVYQDPFHRKDKSEPLNKIAKILCKLPSMKHITLKTYWVTNYEFHAQCTAWVVIFKGLILYCLESLDSFVDYIFVI